MVFGIRSVRKTYGHEMEGIIREEGSSVHFIFFQKIKG